MSEKIEQPKLPSMTLSQQEMTNFSAICDMIIGQDKPDTATIKNVCKFQDIILARYAKENS